MKDKPLVSFLMLCYNQSEFVEAAIEGALVQTYSPLEIIISDDCSTDNSYELISSIARNYKGPHKLIINRNSKNMGTSEHLNRTVAKANGDFLIFAAADDISSKDRIEVFTEYLENESHLALFSNVIKINRIGESSGTMFKSKPSFAESIDDISIGKPCWTIGASFACSKRIFDTFSKLPASVLQEDGCIVFRALLLGSVGYIDEPLVSYRAHSGSVSQHQSASKRLTLKRSEYYMHLSNLQDALSIKNCDEKTIKYLIKKKQLAFIKHCLYKIPLLGLSYNKIRIVLGSIRRSVQ